MNTKKVQKAIDKAFKKLSKLSNRGFRELVKKTPDRWGTLLARGGFFDPAGKHLSDKERLEQFPDLRHQKSVKISFDYPFSFLNSRLLKDIGPEILNNKIARKTDFLINENIAKIGSEESDFLSTSLRMETCFTYKIELGMSSADINNKIYPKRITSEKLTNSISTEKEEIKIEDSGWTRAA